MGYTCFSKEGKPGMADSELSASERIQGKIILAREFANIFTRLTRIAVFSENTSAIAY
jgi:hypothetical protein